MFKYKIDRSDTELTAYFEGDLDIEVTETLEDQFYYECTGVKTITIDFKNVSFVDSTGIGLLIDLVTKLKNDGADVRIIHVSDDVNEIFTILQISTILGDGVIR